MEKTIKYLENGEYHYATVKDVGDLAKLKTDSKDDLVTAINELFITGGEASKKPDGYDELVDNVADAIQKQQQMTDTITNMQQSAQLSDAEMQHMKQVQEEAHQDYIKALKEFNDAIAQANADALELDKKTDELKKNADDLNKKTNDLQDKLNETFTNVANEVLAVHKQLDTESAGLHKELNDTKTSLEATRKDLLNNTQEFGVVNSEVKELKDKMDRRIWSTDLDPVREQVSKNSTEVAQTKDELKSKADQSNLDLVTNSVENLSTQVKENADGLKVSVKKDELGGDVAKLLNDKTNLLLGTRNFSGDSWGNKTHWHEEPGYWKGLKVFSSTEMWSGLQYKYEVKQGQQYTFSFWARQEKDNSSASIVLSESDKGDQGIATPYVRGVHIGTEWKRYSLTFQAESDGIIYPRVEQNVQGNKLYIAGYKLELGSVATPWEPNEADVAENIEHNESQFNVYSDQIAGIVKKQEKMGDTERQLDTRITETAEGLKQTSKDLQDANGKITEFKGQLESTARGLKTEYEKYTNDAIGQISDSSLNLIRNSAFQNKDDNFAQWQNVSAKANIREDGNGLRWVEITQSGMTTSNPQGITSNYFNVKQGKVTVAVDIKSGDKAELDNESVLFLELYDNAKKRVDFHWVTLSDLGLSKSLLNDHRVHRGLYRLAIDRADAQYMTVKAHLIRNGDLWFTNFSARLSSIDDGGYTPNPDDVNQQILKQNTKIEQNAKEVAIKANSVDVTRDIKSAVDGIRVGGRNLANGTDKEYTMGYGIPNTTWQNGYAYESLPTKILTREILPQNGQFFTNLVPGQEYTQTIWFETDADVKKLNAAITWFTNVGHDEQPAKIIKVGENSYKLFSTYIWPGKTDNNVRLFDIFYLKDAFDLSTGTYIKFGKLKLEEGNVSTDWTPSLQDTSEEIKSAKDAAIQVASDQIDLHVNELRTSFDDKLNKQINEAKSASQKFTSDGIEQTVKKITDVKSNVDELGNRVDGVDNKVNNLQVGGRNYISPSQIAGNSAGTPQYDSNSQVWTVNVGNGVGGSWGGGIQFAQSSMSVPWGKAYTDSVEVYVTDSNLKWQIDINNYGVKSDSNLAGNDNDDRGRAVIIPSTNDSLPTNQWVKLSVTVWNTNPKNKNHTDLWDGSSFGIINQTGHTVTVKFRRPKQELGSKATDWSPNPDDTTKEIKSAQDAAIKIASDQIDLHVNELRTSFDDKLSKQVNEAKSASQKFTSDGIEQTVKKITDVKNQVDGIRVGARNLLHGTSDKYRTLTGDNYLCQTTATDFYTSTANYHAGDWFTYAATISNNSTKNVTLETWLFDGSKKSLTEATAAPYPVATHSEVVQPGQGDKRVSTSFRISGNTWYVRTYVIFDGGGAPANSKVQVKDERLVEGNMAGTWSPNPDDVDKKIDTQTLESVNIDDLKTQGHYFVHNLIGNPVSGWVYVDVMGVDGRIRQDVYQDNGNKHMYRRLFGTAWSPWEQGAYLSDVNAAKTEVTASVKNLGDRVTTEVNSVTSRVDNLKAGGQNLVADGDASAYGATAWENTTFQTHPFYYNSTKLMFVIDTSAKTELTAGCPNWFPVKAGHQYTFYFNGFMSTNVSSYDVWLLGKKADAQGSWTDSYQIVAGERLDPGHNCIVTRTFTVPSSWNNYVAYIRFDNNGSTDGHSAVFFFNEVSLKEGNINTGYSPAPENTVNEIKKLNTKWDVANGQIQGKVTATDVNNILNGKGYATQSWAQTNFRMKSDSIDLEVKKITDPISNKINNLQVGGRNLLHGTSDQWRKFTSSGWGCFTTAQSSEVSMAEYHTGNVFTYSATISNNGKHDVALQLRPLNSQKKPISYYASAPVKPGQQNMRVSCTAPVDENTWYMGVWVYFPSNNGSNDVVWVKEEQLEEGNVRTPWTPNPDDTIEAIKEVNTKWNIANGQIQGKVTATDVNNILNGKGYATTSTVQSLITQKAGTINESITNLTSEMNARNGVNLLKGTADFSGNWFRSDDGSWVDDNWRDTYNNRVRKRSGDAWNGLGQMVYLEPGNYTLSLDMFLNLGSSDSLNFYADNQYNGTANIVQMIDGNRYDHSSPQGKWFRAICHFKVIKTGNVSIRPELNQYSGTVHVGSYKLEKGMVTSPVWTPAPSDNATVTQVQQITASIDGLQSTVANKADKSQITQLSNLVQSKVSSSDFNNLRKAVDLQTLDSADINNMKTNGHYFVHNLANNPVGGWVYVDITGNGTDRIRQDVYQDGGNQHKYRRWFGNSWTDWSQGATESEITQLRDDINLRVKSGDLLSQINLTAHNTLIQSNKIYLDSSSTVFSGKAFIPSAAIVNLDAGKINTGTLNTQTVSIGDDQTRLWARSNHLYVTGKDQGDAYNMRICGDKIEFVTTEIPNNAPYLGGITPMYSIEYNGDSKARLKIRSFNRLTGSNEFPIEMYDSINISKDQLDFVANNQMKMQVVDGGVNIRPTLFLQNNTRNGTWAGFTRLDNSDTVEFNTGNNNGENFHVNSGARFRQYLYVDGWLSCYQLKQTSLLSEKTDIEELDPEEALNMVRQDKQYLYKYKQDVQKGIIDQQAGLIIDDQNKTPVYTPPKVFLDSTGKSREPNVELAYLIAAFQELDRRNQKLEQDIRELKGEVIHE